MSRDGEMLAHLAFGNGMLSQLLALSRSATVPGALVAVGPTAAVAQEQVRTYGGIPNTGRLGWFTVENRAAVPLGLTPAAVGTTAPQRPADPATFTVPPLYRSCLPVEPSMGLVWSLAAPGPVGWTAARRTIPYAFHAGGSPSLDPLYPLSGFAVTVEPGAIANGAALIVQPAAALRPRRADAAITACLVALDVMGAGAMADLVSVEPCYDLAADGATAAAPWGSVFAFAGAGAQAGVTATLELAGATGVQITNHNAGAGQSVTPLVTLFYGVPG
jgi:hypothetical protein